MDANGKFCEIIKTYVKDSNHTDSAKERLKDDLCNLIYEEYTKLDLEPPTSSSMMGYKEVCIRITFDKYIIYEGGMHPSINIYFQGNKETIDAFNSMLVGSANTLDTILKGRRAVKVDEFRKEFVLIY